jgi:hypothetical protein
MNINNLIVPDIGIQTLNQVFTEYLTDINASFQLNRQQLIDFYMSQQTDKDSYLKDYFKRKNADGTPGYPENLVLTQLNITSKIIDKKAKCYQSQPVRMIDGSVDEEYNKLLLDGGIKSTSKQMDVFTWLLGDVCTIFIADAKTKKLKFLNPPYYIPVFDKMDNINPVGVMYPCGLIDASGKNVEGWVYWDAEKYLLYDSTWKVLEQSENVHGVFNAIFTHRIKPFLGHYTKDAQDLIDTNRDVNIALTAFNNALRISGFPVWVALGVKDGQKEIQISFDRLIMLFADLEKNSQDFKAVNPGFDFVGILTSIKTRCELLATTWNIQFEIVGSISLSGLAIKILTEDHSNDVNNMKELYEEYFEIPLFEKLKIASTKIDWIPKITGEQLTCDWAEEEFYETPTEKLNRLKTEIELNLTTAIEEIKKRNPDLDDETAIAKYMSNAALNKKLSSGQITEEEALDIILGNKIDEIDNTEINNEVNKETNNKNSADARGDSNVG